MCRLHSLANTSSITIAACFLLPPIWPKVLTHAARFWWSLITSQTRLVWLPASKPFYLRDPRRSLRFFGGLRVLVKACILPGDVLVDPSRWVMRFSWILHCFGVWAEILWNFASSRVRIRTLQSHLHKNLQHIYQCKRTKEQLSNSLPPHVLKYSRFWLFTSCFYGCFSSYLSLAASPRASHVTSFDMLLPLRYLLFAISLLVHGSSWTPGTEWQLRDKLSRHSHLKCLWVCMNRGPSTFSNCFVNHGACTLTVLWCILLFVDESTVHQHFPHFFSRERCRTCEYCGHIEIQGIFMSMGALMLGNLLQGYMEDSSLQMEDRVWLWDRCLNSYTEC